MMTIPGYKINKELRTGRHSVIYQGQRSEDGIPVIIKVHRDEYPTVGDMDRFRREFDIGSLFRDDHIIRYYATESYRHALALIQEDFGAVALAEVIPEDGLGILPFLNIAVQLAEGLRVIHQQNVIHKDINPRNIVIRPGTDAVKFIDFGISCWFTQETQEAVSPKNLIGIGN